MAPENRPKVLLGTANELVSAEYRAITASTSLTGNFKLGSAEVHTSVDISDQAALNLTEPTVELCRVSATSAEVVVENQRSHNFQIVHEVFWRVSTKPFKIVLQKPIQIIGKVSITVGADACSKQSN